MDFVLLFPGQGSQKPGMGKDLAESSAAARRVFAAADETLGAPLSKLCFEGPAEELMLTHNAQPALLAHGAAAWATVADALRESVVAAAGHSLGEFTAYHAAGALDLAAAVKLVRRRGELMYETGLQRPGAMAAILGDTSEPIEALCTRASAETGLVVPANYNSPGQVVVSGEEAGVERVMALARETGAKRAIRLQVSGAFHSPLMVPAREGLAAAIGEARLSSPAFPVYANVDASPVTDGARAEDLLLRQLTSPVRWTAVVSALAAAFPDATFVEVGPGAVLSGLVKKIAPGRRVMTCGTSADVDLLLGAVA